MTKGCWPGLLRNRTDGHQHFYYFEHLKIEPEKAQEMARLLLKTYSATLTRGKTTSIEPRTAKGIVCDFLTSATNSTYKDLLKKRTVSNKKSIML